MIDVGQGGETEAEHSLSTIAKGRIVDDGHVQERLVCDLDSRPIVSDWDIRLRSHPPRKLGLTESDVSIGPSYTIRKVECDRLRGRVSVMAESQLTTHTVCKVFKSGKAGPLIPKRHLC